MGIGFSLDKSIASVKGFGKKNLPGKAIKSVKTNVPDTKLLNHYLMQKIQQLQKKGAQDELIKTNSI